MRSIRFALALILAVSVGVAIGSEALAQQVGPGASTGGGSGTGAGTGSGGPMVPKTPDHGKEIDLPLEKPDTSVREDEDSDFNEDGDIPLYDEDVPSEGDSIYYVIDISGSMGWGSHTYTGLDGNTTSGTRLDRAKVEVQRSILALTDDFKFNIVAYHCSASRWRSQRQEATDQNKSSAGQWVNALRATGATGTGPATALALGDKDNKTVALLSDGAPNCGASGFSGHANMISGANTQGAIIHTFGIGAYGQFENFLRGIAQGSGGNYIPVN
jgi:hypothetical protein